MRSPNACARALEELEWIAPREQLDKCAVRGRSTERAMRDFGRHPEDAERGPSAQNDISDFSLPKTKRPVPLVHAGQGESIGRRLCYCVSTRTIVGLGS